MEQVTHHVAFIIDDPFILYPNLPALSFAEAKMAAEIAMNDGRDPTRYCFVVRRTVHGDSVKWEDFDEELGWNRCMEPISFSGTAILESIRGAK